MSLLDNQWKIQEFIAHGEEIVQHVTTYKTTMCHLYTSDFVRIKQC